MWVPWVVEGLKVVMVYFLLELIYGGSDQMLLDSHECDRTKEC